MFIYQFPFIFDAIKNTKVTIRLTINAKIDILIEAFGPNLFTTISIGRKRAQLSKIPQSSLKNSRPV